MPAVRTALRRPRGVLAVYRVRALVGFCLLGLVNVVLPSIIFSSSYLIIPYSQPTVALIQGLPSLATKLVLPHVLRHISWWIRPCFLAASWILAAVVTAAAPPNVPPLVRILMTMLASASAAAAEVSFLSQMRYYARWGLAGWGIGTGIGGAAVAVTPYLITYGMGVFLRTSVDCVYYLVGILLAAYFVVLPPAPLPRIATKSPFTSPASSDGQENIPLAGMLPSRSKRSWALARPLLVKFAVPLFTASSAQAFVFPASTRLRPMSPSLPSFSQFSAAFGAALRMGDLITRASIIMSRRKQLRSLFALLAVAWGLQLINLFSLIASSTFPLLLLASSVGVAGGAIYMTVLSAVLDYTENKARLADADFCIGVVSSGETAGGILASLLGGFMEMGYCASETSSKGRWCTSTR
ncbi:Golgi integral membrane protein (Cln3) [Metarhizium album ARSEF 1941]|uniref:Protein BTN n=1 Tax=Metarhizium album (strain ARSEF 1941) TaxID=1081103 RepID=A0A0B2X6F0_METAS|nr:Golgi integral membrane protein (Cln3) [Metarhizium album ARSEF 1941]KHO01313.1 Golgi integral membrane protein (Cln3) [Metarhizium album ARSEF 1941]